MFSLFHNAFLQTLRSIAFFDVNRFLVDYHAAIGYFVDKMDGGACHLYSSVQCHLVHVQSRALGVLVAGGLATKIGRAHV